MDLKNRYYSLDVFRGMTVVFMILVNNPGSWSHIYAPLEHSVWNGCTPTDLVFPFFLFAVGNALAFVMPGFRKNGDKVFLRKVFKRFVLIFLIGLLLNWFPFAEWNENSLVFKGWDTVRILGVLQRIAIAYLFASLIIYYFKNKGAAIASAVILIAYAFICYYYNASEQVFTFGVPIDAFILGESHMYHGEIVDGKQVAFDPEGLVSSITPIVQVIFGYFVGYYIHWKGKNLTMLKNLLIYGICLVGIGYVLDLFMPINKKVWTSSYVIFTTGYATLFIGVLIWLIEFKNWRGAWSKFFDVFGKNPLFIYVMSGILPLTLSLVRIPNGLDKQNNTLYINPLSWFYEYVCRAIFENEKNASLFYALFFIFVMWIIAYFLHKKKIYIKV